MKQIRKIIALAIVCVMMFAMIVPTMAATINVQGVLKGETYTAYQLLHYTTDGKDAYSYYLTTEEYETSKTGLVTLLTGAGFKFVKSSDGSLYYVSNANSLTADGITTYLNTDDRKTTLATVALSTSSATAEANGTITISSLDTGYYFIDSTTGSLCELKSFDAQEVVLEKNTVPSVNKKQKSAEGEYADTILHENIGDTVYYQLVVTDGKGTDADITLVDTMTMGLTYKTGSIKINGFTVADDANGADWSVTVSDQTITIVLKESYVKSLETSETVTITYEATINENAIVDSATDNKNEVTLNYSAQTQTAQVYVETYDISLKKTDGTNALSGAKFNLYTTSDGTTPLTFVKDNTGYYLNTGTGATAEIDAGDGTGINIRGLAPGTYYFEETVAPNGYNKLSERTAVTITESATAAVEITVINNSGSILPSTGGMGTTIIYIIGAALVIISGVLLITKKRMSSDK